MTKRKTGNLLISLLVICVVALLAFVMYYPDESTLGPYFGLSVVYMAIRYVAVTAGCIALLLRLVKLWKDNGNFLYLLLGTLNIAIAAISISLYFIQAGTVEWLNKSLFNLLIGVLIVFDSFVLQEFDSPADRKSE
jgi:hypothetical protein